MLLSHLNPINIRQTHFVALLLRIAVRIFCWWGDSRTSRSRWITQSTQHHRRGCNNIMSWAIIQWGIFCERQGVSLRFCVPLHLGIFQPRECPSQWLCIKIAEAPGKIVTARPCKPFAQLRNVAHAHVSALQKHRSKAWKLVWQLTLQRQPGVAQYGGSYIANLCKQKGVSRKTILLLLWHYTTIFFVIDSLPIFTAQVVHSHT